MRVLFVNTVYGRGSTGKIVRSLSEALAKEGHETIIAYGRGEKKKENNLYYIGSKFSVFFHAFLSRITDKAGFYSKRATKKFIKFIRKFNPDIIHLHNLHGYYLNLKIFFEYIKKEFKGKVIWTLHDCWPYTGHCVHYTYAQCDKWKYGCYKCPEKNKYPKTLFKDNSKKNYLLKKELFSNIKDMTIITVSDWLKKNVQESFLGQYNVVRIYNGIDCDKFFPIEENIKEEIGATQKKVILLVSDGWDDRKGFNTFLSVAEKAPEDWQFIIVGVTKKQIVNLPKNVIGYERIWEQKKLIQLYSSADVFLNPSVEETFGLVTAEAMACGTPAVVINSTACPELVVSQECGEVLENRERVEEIINAIERSFCKKNLSQGFVKENFSQMRFLEEYLEIYKE